MPTSLAEIEYFLSTFQQQLKRGGLIFYNWEANLQALLWLEITAKRRERIIRRLTVDDYQGGPAPHKEKDGIACWEFRTTIREIEVSIQLSLADETGAACCYIFAARE